MSQRYTKYQPTSELDLAIERAGRVGQGVPASAVAVTADPAGAMQALLQVVGRQELLRMLGELPVDTAGA